MIQYLSFLHNQQPLSLCLLLSKGGGFFSSKSLLNTWKSISETEKHSLPPADTRQLTMLEGSWDGHCKKHSLILHKSV